MPRWPRAQGNALWRRSLSIARWCHARGIVFVIEHPRNSAAWRLPETQSLKSLPGMYEVCVHMCEYDGPTKKPTLLLSNAPWIRHMQSKCSGGHVHSQALRGARAREAGAYPWKFCQRFAELAKQQLA
jgi:hypothetical protein